MIGVISKCMGGKSELSSLIDLAIAQGGSHSQLMTEIYEAVLNEYRRLYPKSPADTTVLLDETSGKVRIFSGDKDVTPTGWGSEAARVARQTVIDRLAQGKAASMPQPPGEMIRYKGPSGVMTGLTNLFFWGYNLYFALVIWLWLLSAVRSITSWGVFRGLLMIVLAITPVAAMGLAIRNKLWKSGGSLLKLFFLIELPVVLACVLPLSVMTQTTPFMVLVVLSALGVPMVLYFYEAQTPMPQKGLRMILGLQQAVMMMAGYLGLLLLYWVPIILGGLAKTFLGNMFYPLSYGGGYSPGVEPIVGSLFQGAIGILILLLITGVLLVPYLLIVVLWRAWDKTRQELAQTLPEEQVTGTIAILAAVIITIGGAAAYQPSSTRLVGELKKISTLATFDQQENAAAQIRPQEAKLKQIITDMQYTYRKYLLTRDDRSLQGAYEVVFNMGPGLAGAIQKSFLAAAYPLVYQGERGDYSQLATNFQYVFGYPVYETKTTQPVEVQTVLMTYRKVTVKPELAGAAATVAIEEEYDNQTFQQQEVIYEFSLPTGAAVTGLRLGADLEFPGVIAPKGAAQRTYEQQLQTRRDPALLEETGPGQYRLRVFPIPGKNDFNTLKGKRQKVEYTYAVTADPKGVPLPVVNKKTNVFTNTSTQWLLSTGGRLKEDEKFAPGTGFDPCVQKVEQTIGGDSLTASVESVARSDKLKRLACGGIKEAMQSINGAKIGIFYDVSAANKDDQTWKDLTKMLNEDKGFVSRNTVELYKYNEILGAPVRLTEEEIDDVKINYFGRSNVWKALASLKDRYDMVIVVTGAKEAWTNQSMFAFSPATQVFIMHTGTVAAYPMQITSKLTQSRGSVVSTVEEAVREYALEGATREELGPAAEVIDRYFGVGFSGREMTSQIPAPVASENAGLEAVVNRALVKTAVAANPTDVSGNIAILDQLNEFADAAQVVTPYSSLIALVNELQMQQLENWKQAYNRYQDQPVTGNIGITPFMPVEQPIFDTFRGPGMVNPFGVDLLQTDLKGISGGSGAVGAPSMMALEGGGSSFGGGGGSSGVGLLFILVNGVLLAGGMGWFLVKILRKKN